MTLSPENHALIRRLRPAQMQDDFSGAVFTAAEVNRLLDAARKHRGATAVTSYEDQGTGVDPGAAGHERQGRKSPVTQPLPCIGGPLDREKIARDGDIFRFTAPGSRDMIYQRRTIVGIEKAFDVWLYDGVSPDEAVEKLLGFYVADHQ